MAKENPRDIMLRDFTPDLNSIKPYIERLLPWKGGVERFVQMTELAVRRNFDLLTCDRNSFLLALLWCAQKNLEPGVDDGCWLIPFKQVVTPVPAYKGLIKVAIETESVRDVQPYPVYAADTFEYTLGLDPSLTHIPPKFGSDRGALVGAYVVFTMLDGSKRFPPPMDRASIEKIRDVSPAYKADKTGSIWVKWEEAMFLKTAIKQGFKYIPVKAALRDLIYDDGQLESGTRVGVLLQQTGIAPPELGEDKSPESGKLSPAPEPVDISKFDALVLEKLKDLDPETKTVMAARLGQFIRDTAAAKSTKKKLVTAEMIMAYAQEGHFAPYDLDGKPQKGLWQMFLDWLAMPEREWNQPGQEGCKFCRVGNKLKILTEGPCPHCGREMLEPPLKTQSPKAEAAAGEEPPPETYEQRVERVWGLVTDRTPPLADMKAKTGVTNRATITPENIDSLETYITGYEKKK